MSNSLVSDELILRMRQFMEEEARSCSMEPSLITPEYVFRMWGGSVSMEEIKVALDIVRA